MVESVPAVWVVLKEDEEAVEQKYQTEAAVLNPGVTGEVDKDLTRLWEGLGCSNLQL